LSDLAARVHSARTTRDLLDMDGIGALDATVLDPNSLIFSTWVKIGRGNVFYPNVVIECDTSSTCQIGDNNVFWPGTLIVASGGGSVTLGDDNTIGQGGAQIKAHGTAVRIGSRTRIINGAEILCPAVLGDGCQVLGPISVRFVELAAGGDFHEPDPDVRGAVLKGGGSARGITLRRGEVIYGYGDFSTAGIERQLAYHPR
jgi:hypothetical protein